MINKSVKTVLVDSRKLNDSCVKIRPHMPNMEELLNQIAVEEMNISKIDLDYAYGQMNYQKKQADNAYSH